MVRVKNEFKPWIVLVGVVIFILVALACFLPHWLEWQANQNANTGLLLGILSTGHSISTSNLDINAGLWETEVEYAARGVASCATTTTPANCVCPNLLDGDVDLPSLSAIDFTGAGIPNCNNIDVDGCTATRVGATVSVNYATSVKADCDPTILADVLRCGARSYIGTTATNVFDTNYVSSACNGAYNRIDDCMAGYLSASRTLYVIALVLIVLIVLLYLFMPCVGPLSLPKIALLGVILVFLNAVAVTLALIFAILGFRYGCGNSWNGLTGDVHWGACLILAIIAAILSWLWLCWAIMVWRQAKQIRNWFIYDHMRYAVPAPVYKVPYAVPMAAPVMAAPAAVPMMAAPAAMAAPVYTEDYGGYKYITPAAPPAAYSYV